ncbi:MAG: transcriptional regulator [Rhodobacterales bacterium]|nr:MAG: transcriptional regulator [Rhodobacterales bacterium]
MSTEFEERLAKSYEGLSDQLRRAGDFVATHPFDTASRSMRSVAREAEVAPASFTRLAKALGYDGFESLRDSLRAQIGDQVRSFADRAEAIGESVQFATAHLEACRSNLDALSHGLDPQALTEAADLLSGARRVYLFGALGATGIVEYLSYLAHYCTDNWHLIGRQGGSLGGGLAAVTEDDVLIVVTKPPFSSRAIRAARFAEESGAHVMVLTDSHTCPALRYAQSSFILPTESPHFYSSYVATLTLIEILIGMVVGRSGPAARDRIARVEQSNRRLDELLDG